MADLYSKLIQLSSKSPERLAVQFKQQRLSYGDVVSQLRTLQRDLGCREGMRVLLVLPDGLASYLLQLHFFVTGTVVVPQSAHNVTPYLKRICEQAEPHLIVTNAALYKRHERLFAAHSCLIVRRGASAGPLVFDYELTDASRSVARHFADADRTPQDVRVILFTSGSTGAPKGVCLSEANLVAAAKINTEILGLDASRKSLVTVPLYDYYGYIQIASHILGDCGWILGESISFPDQLIRRLREDDVTDVVLVPYTLRQLLDVLEQKPEYSIAPLRFVASSSDALTGDLLERLFHQNPTVRVYNVYGLTEAGRACFREISKATPPSESIGGVSPGMEIQLDGTREDPGEIVIRGPTVMQGYLDGIVDDRVCFNPCSEVRAEDLAYYDDDGEIVLVGRRDHMISIMGAKIHPREIELIALQLPQIRDVVVRASSRAGREKTIHMDVVLRDPECNIATIRDHLRRSLHRFFVPAEIDIVSRIKRTELGSKVIR